MPQASLVRSFARHRTASLGLALALSTFGLAVLAKPPPAPTPAQSIQAAAIDAPDSAPIRAAATKLSAKAKQWGAQLGVTIIDIATGDVIAEVDSHRALNPASNAKLVTAATALHVLGGEYRFLTGLYGRIQGDEVTELVLRGQGDPSLTTADLWSMAGDLRAAGVRKVGTILVDQSYFDEQYEPPAFAQQPNEWAPFRAPIAAVSLNENTVTFIVRPDGEGKRAKVSVDPPGFVDLSGEVRTAPKKSPEKVAVSLSAEGDRLAAKLSGELPADSRVMHIARRVDDPRLLAGYALRDLLSDGGMHVEGPVRLGGEKNKRLLVAHRSAPLGELLTALGKSSDNFYAEMVFKALGTSGKGKSATTDRAAEVATAFLRDRGAFEEGVVVKNGSGLFDANRTSASALATLLRVAYLDGAIRPELVSQLAIAGVDGTLRGRLRVWGPRRAVRAKTGTLDAVATLSGYVLAPPGRSPVAFSILFNDVSGKVSAARVAMDELVDTIAKELWRGAP